MKNLLTLVFLLIAFNSNAQRALFGGDNNYVVPVIPFSAPAIVTNGLVVNLDAGNPDSYNGGGTNWRDLSGNGNNGTLVNGPTYGSSNGGHFLLDGTDDYISLPSSNFFNFSETLCAGWLEKKSACKFVCTLCFSIFLFES